MKYTLLIPMLIAGLLLKFCTNSKEVTQEVTDTDPVIEQTGNIVQPRLNGFNAENLFFHFQGETDAIELIKSIRPNVLRFPGGTPANVYHIDGAGYGYDEADLEKMNT
ncbi:MAG: hypothetical protein HKN79_04460, partial [Flavobacteriales bacterium]|nr:hypothetical protein [Flavobacteriales bacterium]